MKTLPREIAPGVTWIGACMELAFHGAILHTYDSAYLVRGETSSLLVEAGMPADRSAIEAQLEVALDGAPPLRHIWVTHQETPHAGNLGSLLRAYPDAQLSGNVSDYHLFFPEFRHRFVSMEVGESIDLGGRSLTIAEAVIKDLSTSQWAVDSASRTLFPGDGFAYAHYHDAAHCGCTAQEAVALGMAEEIARFSEQSLYWARFTDMEPHIERLRRLIENFDIQHVGPTHGLPITDVHSVLPTVEEGLRMASTDLPDGYTD